MITERQRRRRDIHFGQFPQAQLMGVQRRHAIQHVVDVIDAVATGQDATGEKKHIHLRITKYLLLQMSTP